MASTRGEDDTGDTLEYLVLTVYKPFIVDHVKCSHLLLYMDCMRDSASEIYKLDRNGEFKKAAQLFLERLERLDECGKWQSFKQALKDADYEHVSKLLEGDIGAPNHMEHRQMIDFFAKPIADTIDVRQLLPIVKSHNLINEEEGQHIHQIHTNFGSISAAVFLLDCVYRHKTDWYETLMNIFLDNGYEHLVQHVDPHFLDKKQRQRENESEAASSEMGKDDMENMEADTQEEGFIDMGEQDKQEVGGNLNPENSGMLSVSQESHSGTDLSVDLQDQSMISQRLQMDTVEGDTTSATQNQNSAHTCGCCSTLTREITSLRSEITEMKEIMEKLLIHISK